MRRRRRKRQRKRLVVADEDLGGHVTDKVCEGDPHFPAATKQS